jgi:hypothetical protein
MVHYQGDDPLLMMFSRYRIVAVVTIVLILFVLLAIPPQAKARFVLIEPNKEFSPSAVTYTNKTMHFQDGDPYEGYSYWTYEVVGDTQGPSSNRYYVGTDDDGDYEYFGFDEFVDHSVVSAQVIFDTSAITGTYHFQPLGYFYQKTNLESNTRWALVLDWDSTGIDLYYNSGNGDTPTSVNLVGTAVSLGVDYNITLSNLGDQTFVEIQDISTHPTYPIIYSGYIATESYDATSLYAGFGQYCSGDGSIIGVWDDFAIFDSIFTYSEVGTGFRRIDAYLDEVFTQTLYDMDEGFNRILDIDETITNITLLVDCWLNSTTYGVSTIAEGKNIIRQSMTVTSTNNTIVFSQTNLTYISGFDYGDNVFLYQYSVQLDFTIIYGNIYTVVLTYEIFY